MKNHAYLIMAHNNFPLLLDLITRLDHPRNHIYLHIDRKVSDSEFTGLKADYEARKASLQLQSPLFFTDRISVHWGGYSQIACELLLLQAAVPSGPYAYYHLLSGSDLPLKTPEEILSFFDQQDPQDQKEFIAMDGPTVSDRVRERISLYHVFRESSSPLAEPLDMVWTRLQRLFGVDRLRKESLRLQKGANWFSITDGLARYVLEHREEIARIFGHSVCADELFLQTLVLNSPFAGQLSDPSMSGNSMANLRYVDWERGANNNPYVFQDKDKEMLLKQPHLFARKFTSDIFR